MTTVKEFRDLGVPFVDGDECRDNTGSIAYTEGWYVYGNAGDKLFDQCKVTHFAWRPLKTLPDNPKFLCDINYGDHSWRPSLDQSKAADSFDGVMEKLSADRSLLTEFKHYGDNEIATPKPVFTQEAADIKVGFKLKFNHDINGKFKHLHDERYGWEDGDNLEVIHITKNHDGEVCFIVLNCQEDVLTTAAIIDTSFFDTRTPKQKAVDDALELIGYTNEGEVAIHLGQVYDLWHK